MDKKVQKVKLFSVDDKDVMLYRLSNETGDYIDVTNYGLRVTGLNVHKPDGNYENLLKPGFKPDRESLENSSFFNILTGSIGEELLHTPWNIIGEGDEFVMFSSETKDSIKVGVKVTWLKLNRLVFDIFTTPKDETEVCIQSKLDLVDKTFEISTFCQRVDGVHVSDTPYKDMAFVSLPEKCGPFSSESQEIKPMIELKEVDSPLRISVYTTLGNTFVDSKMNCVSVSHSNMIPEKLAQGETLTERVIYGIDYITVSLASDEKDPESPFEGLLLGGL